MYKVSLLLSGSTVTVANLLSGSPVVHDMLTSSEMVVDDSEATSAVVECTIHGVAISVHITQEVDGEQEETL